MIRQVNPRSRTPESMGKPLSLVRAHGKLESRTGTNSMHGPVALELEATFTTPPGFTKPRRACVWQENAQAMRGHGTAK